MSSSGEDVDETPSPRKRPNELETSHIEPRLSKGSRKRLINHATVEVDLQSAEMNLLQPPHVQQLHLDHVDEDATDLELDHLPGLDVATHLLPGSFTNAIEQPTCDTTPSLLNCITLR